MADPLETDSESPEPEPVAIKTAKTHVKRALATTAAGLRTQLAELRAFLGEGKTDFEVMELMEIGVEAYNALKREFYRQETVELNGRSTEQTYIDYLIQQRRIVVDLDKFATRAQKAANYHAELGAMKAKSDILDKLIRTGQELGVIDKTPEKKVVIHGHAIATMSDSRLRKLVINELVGLNNVTKRYGFTDMEGNPLPVEENVIDTPDVPMLPAPAAPAPEFSAKGRPSKSTAKGKSMAGRASAIGRKKSAVAPPLTPR